MDINLEQYGWSGDVPCSINDAANRIDFTGDGYIYNTNTFQEKGKKIEVSGSFLFNSVDMGLVLWYNNKIGMFIFSTDGEILEIKRIYEGNESILQRTTLSASGIAKPDNYDAVQLSVELVDNQILCYYNSQQVLEVEDSAFKEGYFGIYGESNAMCSSFNLVTESIPNWTVNTSQGSGIKTQENSVEFSISAGLTTGDSSISQDVDIISSGDYTVSFDYKGEIYLDVYQGATLINSYQFISIDSVTRGSATITINTPQIFTFTIGTRSEGTHNITYPQLEKRSFDTSYVEQSRGDSKVTFPVKELNKDIGAIGMWIKPTYDYLTGSLPIFYYAENFRLDYTSGNFVLVYGSKTISISKLIEENKDYYISCSWENGSYLGLNIHDEELGTDHNGSATLNSESVVHSDYIYIGSNEAESGNFVIDNLTAINGIVLLDELNSNRYDEEVYNEKTVLKCSFNERTLIYDKNKLSIPIPRVDSPVIVSTLSGKEYERVYFLEDGKYSLFNTEEFYYDGVVNVFEVDFDNIASLKAYSSEDGQPLTAEVDGREVTVDIPAEYEDTYITLSYSLMDTFCINYNKELKQYYMKLSNADGEDILIQYEDYYGTEEKLLRTVELNPFKSSNHEGFIYIEDKARKLETFDIKISPDSIVANGKDVATITIDCLSIGGMPTSNVSGFKIITDGEGNETIEDVYGLNVKSNIGSPISRYISPEEETYNKYKEEHGEEAAKNKYGNLVTEEHRSGRFIYKYKAPGSIEEQSMTDKINIYDTISGIGVQIPIRIVRE